MQNAYEFIFTDGKFISKLLTEYCKESKGFMISFLPTSIIISPNYGSKMYSKAMIEVPYENMAEVGYINPESQLYNYTIQVRCQNAPLSLKYTDGMIKIYASMEEYMIVMRIVFFPSNMAIESTMNIEGVYGGMIESPFTYKKPHLITTIPRSWLSLKLRDIGKKTNFTFSYSSDSIYFEIDGQESKYPNREDVDSNYTVVRYINPGIISALKNQKMKDKTGVVKAFLVDGQCWFVFIISDWGQYMIRMSSDASILE